jgi:arylsulfatase A-like enzyme
METGMHARIAPAALVALLACACACARPAPNVLLVTLDTTRPDHLGCYGHAGGTSPNLDRLADQAILYTRAYATSSWTLPSHASLFTGRFAASHGARLDAEGPLALTDAIDAPESWSRYRARGLAPGEVTLAATLRDAGFATGGVVGGPWLERVFGLDAGFESWDDSGITTVQGARAGYVTDRALAWLEQVADRRFFLFLNYFDPHAPYQPPREFFPEALRAARPGHELSDDEKRALYDGEIRYMDRELGRLLDALRERGVYDDTWIVVTADHGELLGEYARWGHSRTLFEEEIRIPLIVKPPRGTATPSRRSEPVQLTDVMPMLLAGLGLPVPEPVQGRAPPHALPIVAETNVLPPGTGEGDWRALVDGRFKYLWSSLGNHRVHDLERTPPEADNLLEPEAQRAQELAARLEHFLASLPPPQAPPAGAGEVQPVDPETRRALESLGYLEGRAEAGATP